jgi:hypothetical protein
LLALLISDGNNINLCRPHTSTKKGWNRQRFYIKGKDNMCAYMKMANGGEAD